MPLALLAACGAAPATANAPAPAAPSSNANASTPRAAAPLASPSLALGAAPQTPAPPATTETSETPTPQGARAPTPSGEPEPLPKGTLVLQIGDSFAGALGVELGKRLNSAGVRSALEYKTASYIPNWSFGGDVPKFVAKYQPDLVLITLGANEIEIPKPEQRAGAIRHLVAEVGGRPCVWIAPPLWKPDTGLMQVIRDNVLPCRYFDSNALVHDLPRGKDKIHPSPEGREIWAEIVFQWLSKERTVAGARPWALRPEAAIMRETSPVP